MDFALYPLLKLMVMAVGMSACSFLSLYLWRNNPNKRWVALLPLMLVPLFYMGLFRITSPQQAEAVTSQYDTKPVSAEPVIIKQKIVRYQADDNQDRINQILKEGEE